jgi:N-acetylglucosaminyldiphosphoundecaprenol N-acetyl-beta-D-mannosaminyltransferase
MRNILCVLGFPIDEIELNTAEKLISEFIKNQKQCVLSTINQNFMQCACESVQFRCSVVNSDISVIDGFPVLIVSKFLGLPIKTRTSGSVLVKYIIQN